eukprot:gene8033-biopygen18098
MSPNKSRWRLVGQRVPTRQKRLITNEFEYCWRLVGLVGQRVPTSLVEDSFGLVRQRVFNETRWDSLANETQRAANETQMNL